VYGPLPELLIRPLAVWPCAWTEAAVPATSSKPRSILPAAVVMLVDRIKLDCDAFFMSFPFALVCFVLAKMVRCLQ
jgi:hypothetical protein